MENSKHYKLSLAIAGLGMDLLCNNSSLVESLKNRYLDFPKKKDTYLSLEIKVKVREQTTAHSDKGIKFDDKGIYFTAPGYKGQIIPDQGFGELILSSRIAEEDVDYFIRVAYSLLAFRAGGVMLHAAGIVREGFAYLFLGHSGAGKTTVSRLSSKFTVLNDDLVILIKEGKDWWAYGTPFCNPSQVKPAPRCAPIKAIFSLIHANEVQLASMRSGEGVAELIANTPILSEDPIRIAVLLERFFQITRCVQVKRLYFLKDASFWDHISNLL